MVLASRMTGIKWGSAVDGKNNPNFTGGKYVDDKGYVRVLKPEHPFANARYVYEHRLVAEKVLGRYLQPWETVHHINEIKLDNRWDNFYLTTPAEHSAIHREGKKKNQKAKNKMREVAKNRMKNKDNRINGRFSSQADLDAAVVQCTPKGSDA